MKTSPFQHGYLSAEELEKFLSGKMTDAQRSAAQKLLDDCELSKEAVEGFSAVPAALADIPSLHAKIGAAAGMKTGALVLKSIIAVTAIAVVAAVTYFAWPENKSQPPAPVTTVSAPAQENVPAENVLSPSTDNFVNPEAKTVFAPVVITAKAGKDSASPVTEKPEEMVMLPSVPVTDSVVAVKVVPAKPETGYNAEVGFVLDLKVTDFSKLYNGVIEEKELQLTGVPAQFDDAGERDAEKKDEPAVRKVPAETYLRDGLAAFRDGHYGRCIEKMDVLRSNNPEDLNAVFYTGVSYVKLEMYSKAVPLFDKILASTNNVFHEEAKWYKAQALEGEGDVAGAKQLYSEIVSAGGFYAAKAQEKLKGLK
ncbi:MAG TPA: hypothetical protein VFU15_01900 [Bacteroidia bacterium]|nr:hypothetical protein [Bacteroidia bacterium]